MRLILPLLLALVACTPDPSPNTDDSDAGWQDTDEVGGTDDTDPDTDTGVEPVDADQDGFAEDVDCDDEDPDTFPGAPEEDCTDPVDRNCDGQVPLYADADVDGVPACSDCDDSDPTTWPGAIEVCDGVDNDCDGLDDDDDEVIDKRTWYLDRDFDGYGTDDRTVVACEPPFGFVGESGDCDDEAPWVSPYALERCDGIDNDCDGLVDTEDDDIVDRVTWFRDADGDGWGNPDSSRVACDPPSGHVGNDLDCDDADRTSPVAVPLFRDRDGDSYGDPSTREPRCDRPSGYVEDDRDCDDSDRSVNPMATEVCDGVDNDCDADVDDDDADVTGVSSWYPDSDGDSYGSSTRSPTVACVAPTGMVADNTDCVDSDVGVHPTRFDWDDDRDNDCDGSIDEDVGSESVTHDIDVQAIWGTACTRCHGASGGLSLASGTWRTLVNKPARGLTRLDYVEPGYPGRSYVWLKLNNTHRAAGGSGSSMPTTGPLTQAQLDRIETWILEGAVQ